MQLELSKMKPVLSFEEFLASKPPMIFYSSLHCWWTHEAAVLDRPRALPSAIPVDMWGAPLFQTDQVEQWLNKDAIEACASYGATPLEAFMWGNHRNLTALVQAMPIVGSSAYVPLPWTWADLVHVIATGDLTGRVQERKLRFA